MTTPTYDPMPTDPRAALRDAEDAATPATIALRLAVLRADVPDTMVQLDTIRADDSAIAIKATIGRSGGGRASAIAATDVDTEQSWADQLAAVEAVAIARTLDQLGMTTERALAGGRTERQHPAPAPQPSAPQSATQPQPSAQAQNSTPAPAKQADSDHLPEFSWNAFWQHARTIGIGKEQLEQALGRSVQEASPQQAVEALKTAGLWKD